MISLTQFKCNALLCGADIVHYNDSLWIKYDNAEVSVVFNINAISDTVVTAFAWIHNISRNTHTITPSYTMENQFNSPSILCVAFHFAMPSSSIGLLQNDFSLIMDEIDHSRYTHKLRHKHRLHSAHIYSLMVGNLAIQKRRKN